MSRGFDIERDVDTRGLGEHIERNLYFENAGEELAVALTSPYIETAILPDGNYRARVVQGDRRAVVRKGSTAWTKDYAYFVSNIADVYVDIAIHY